MVEAGKLSRRFHDLDALRGAMMFLGIVLHSSFFVIEEAQPIWPIHEPAASGDATYSLVMETIHGFRMPVFFLLSGFFTALLTERQGLRSLAVQRLQRLGIPLVFGCLTVVPLSFWLLAVAADYGKPFDFSLWLLPLAWIQDLGHLWFLWNLLLIVGCFALATRLGVQFRHPLTWWLAIPSSMLLSLAMVEPIFGADNSTESIPDAAVITYYACFFVFGVFFCRMQFAVRWWWTFALLPAAAAFWAGFHLLEQFLAAFEGSAPIGEVNGSVPDDFMFENPLTLASTLIETVCAWLMCFGLMGLFHCIASRESFAVRYLSDASYWMYLMHMPLVVAGQLLLLEWPIHYHLKFLLLCAGVTLILLVTYQLGVRYTIIGETLNGARARRHSQLG